MPGSTGMAPVIPAQSILGISTGLPRRRVSLSPAPTPVPAPTRARWLPARLVRGRDRAARLLRVPPPRERSPLTQARPRVSQAPSRSARRTSSSAGTSGASPPSGNATRTTTARITATRRIAVSVRAPHGGEGDRDREGRASYQLCTSAL